jgi:hypothetical protein
VRYAGAWASSTCGCWSGGTARKSTVKGASATFTYTYDRPGNVAVVMAKGTDRGAATISVDGVSRGTVDTHAGASAARVVVFSAPVSAGRHTVSVMNQASAGHPRIDVDAFLVD